MQKQKVPEPEKYLCESLGPDLVLCPMRVQDLGEVLRIERLSFRSPWSRGQFLDEVQRNPLSYPVVLKEKEGKVIGYCVCWIVAFELHINNVAIDPEERKRGYGETLIRWAVEFGKAASCRNAMLEVRTSNAMAIRLYQKLGFQTLGVAPGYYEDTGEDAYILLKKIRA